MKYVYNSNVHPESGNLINILFRWCSFVPVNIPIIFGLTLLPNTLVNQWVFQALNQAYNFGLNSANGSKDNISSNEEKMKNFSLVVLTAYFGSIGLKTLLEKGLAQSKGKNILMRISPLFGVQLAGSVNLLMSRKKDLDSGLYLLDPETNEKISEIKSKVASKIALKQGIISRIVLPLPCLLISIYDSNWIIFCSK